MKIALLVIMAAGMVPAQPQVDPPGEFIVMTYSNIKPESNEEWYRSQAVLSDALKKGGTPWRSVNAPVFGGGEFLAFTPLPSPADYDKAIPAEKAMGKAAYDKWSASIRKISNTPVRRVMIRPIPGLAILDAPRGSAPLLVVSRVRVASDRAAEWEARVRDVFIPLFRKAGVKRYITSRVVFGGPANEFVGVTTVASLVDAEKVGRAIAQVPPKPGLVLSSERFVYRRHPESSFNK